MDRNTTIITKTPEETTTLAESLANSISDFHFPVIICLYGELGSGKTTFIQGFARKLGVTGRLLSPTFVFMRSYPLSEQQMFHHLDVYRLQTIEELKAISFDELLTDTSSIVAIEWADRLGDMVPKQHIDIYMSVSDEGHSITITYPDSMLK